MIKIAVTWANKVIGYLVDDIYIKPNQLKYITPQRTLAGQRIHGRLKGNYLIYQKAEYTSIFGYLYSDTEKHVIDLMQDNNIVPNDILFFSVKPEQYDRSKMSYDWCTGSKAMRFFVAVDSDGKKLAYLCSRDSLFGTPTFEISMIEVFDKRNGYGRRIIKQLLALNKCLSGLSTANAKPFWEKMGASFDESNHFLLSSSLKGR